MFGAERINIIVPGTPRINWDKEYAQHTFDSSRSGMEISEILKQKYGLLLEIKIGKGNTQLAQKLAEMDNCCFCPYANVKGKRRTERNKFFIVDQHLMKVFYLKKSKNTKS